MIEHYHKKLHEAIESLRKLTGQDVEDTPVLAPQVLAPSQAVLTQFQAAKPAAADAASNG